MISLYSRPHTELLEVSHNTLYTCRYTGQLCLLVLPVTKIHAVVAMPPLPLTDAEKALPPEEKLRDYFYVAEKPFLDAMAWTDDDKAEFTN